MQSGLQADNVFLNTNAAPVQCQYCDGMPICCCCGYAVFLINDDNNNCWL